MNRRQVLVPSMGAAIARATAHAFLALGAVALFSPAPPTRASSEVTATRFPQNPLVTTASSRTLGDNINGPTVIRVPSWVRRPLGRYYMYFAHHMGGHIRLAYANLPRGPWQVYEPGVLNVRDTAFFRPQPDPPENLENFYTHVASPEVYVDERQERLIMWFHGWWTSGERWPVAEREAQAWARQHGYGQYTQAAESTDGLHFTVREPISKTSYLRVFPYSGRYYAIARLGLLLRSDDPLGSFTPGPNAFDSGAYAGRVRHVAVMRRGKTLRVFFTNIGDAPERIMTSTIALSDEWNRWKASPPVDVLQPEAPYECPTLPNRPSEGGDVKERVRQLRDPALFEENGRTFLFYSFCGEQGIAGAELTFR